jgi:hypothetical protein
VVWSVLVECEVEKIDTKTEQAIAISSGSKIKLLVLPRNY